MSSVRTSVIIPAFNSAAWISESLDSAIHQSAPPDQIIVVDDGSTDATAEILARYGGRIQTIHQSNRGVSAARNAGLAAASGELIAFMDADDVWHPRKLELQLRAMGASPHIGLLGTECFAWPSTSMLQWNSDEIPAVQSINRGDLAVKNYLFASSVLLRRDVMVRTGQFDLTMSGTEDHDYWLRAAELTTAAVLRLPLTGYRSVPGSLSKRASVMESGMRRILRKLDDADYWHGDRMLRRRAYSYVDYSSAYMHGAAGNQLMATAKMLRSMAGYPLPFRRCETGASWGRLRRLVVTLLRLTRLMKPDLAM